MKFLTDKKIMIAIFLLLAVILLAYFFDKGLSIGLGLILALSAITFFVLNKLGFKDKKIYLLFLIVLAIHLGTTLFMHYADFQPFSGHFGDYLMYQKSAAEVSQFFKQGNFSIQNIILKYPDFFIGHYYPVVVGAIYALTLPEEIIGLMLNVWLVALSVILVYLIILEIGGLAKNAFIVGLIIAVYPSYIFNSGLLLKDTLEISFIFLGLLFLIKTIKKVTWYNFLIFYLALICATHFRFYMGYALIVAFLLSWFLLSKIDLKRRVVYGVIFIIILGFIPQIAAGHKYYGIDIIERYFNMIDYYRQTAYNLDYWQKYYDKRNAAASHSSADLPAASHSSVPIAGFDSTFQTRGGLLGYAESFVYALLGPFPWQIKYLRQSFALVETIPWYLLLFFVIDGIIISFRKRIKEAAPLLIYSTIVLVLITIFDNNYGLIVRIRIPVFISLLCIASFGFNENNVVYNYLNKIYGKILSYWRSRLYRKPLG
jgi:hypothetical protein